MICRLAPKTRPTTIEAFRRRPDAARVHRIQMSNVSVVTKGCGLQTIAGDRHRFKVQKMFAKSVSRRLARDTE